MDINFKNKNVVFFDGDCGFCNFWVQWILERDRKDRFLFASLQSEFGQKFLSDHNLETKQFNTLYLLKPDGKYLSKSGAVLKIARLLGGIYAPLNIGIILPKPLRDHIYDLVSRNRMKLAAQKCFLPDPHQRKKFIEI
ncbi:DCC1-like thiol-disulfide oxidoreductase family protein [Chryseobacterium wangxinyae]|uniref:thiol-disulfide oxidoreductase DCC family protein n=1 Tax=Chryseobacterium sp. CY350 TaxID=2997336 RepID=UPI00226FD68C|nr:DCC1-like thiol-disulfide oxidoreductase family protein [Chryseobacterium sp. CY350]MCY0977676.1 DCC1-like thiol-disulfide oxidoreductase family protein [Chryseobacterium sp. CY350]WBZ95315.1 DCC1-like thiol-disulfide oxidoreductase family protein [Chryseobacterium sp. CY350]